MSALYDNCGYFPLSYRIMQRDDCMKDEIYESHFNMTLSWHMLLSVNHKFAKKWIHNEQMKSFQILTTNIRC